MSHSDMYTNSDICSLLDEVKDGYRQCEDHASEMLEKNIACLTCSSLICAFCLRGNHQNHNIASVPKLREYSTVKRSLEDGVSKLQLMQKSFTEKIEEKQSFKKHMEESSDLLLDNVDKAFQQLQKIVEDKKHEIHDYIKNYSKQNALDIVKEIDSIKDIEKSATLMIRRVMVFFTKIDIQEARDLPELLQEVIEKCQIHSGDVIQPKKICTAEKRFARILPALEAVTSICQTIRPEATKIIWSKITPEKTTDETIDAHTQKISLETSTSSNRSSPMLDNDEPQSDAPPPGNKLSNTPKRCDSPKDQKPRKDNHHRHHHTRRHAHYHHGDNKHYHHGDKQNHSHQGNRKFRDLKSRLKTSVKEMKEHLINNVTDFDEIWREDRTAAKNSAKSSPAATDPNNSKPAKTSVKSSPSASDPDNVKLAKDSTKPSPAVTEPDNNKSGKESAKSSQATVDSDNAVSKQSREQPSSQNPLENGKSPGLTTKVSPSIATTNHVSAQSKYPSKSKLVSLEMFSSRRKTANSSATSQQVVDNIFDNLLPRLETTKRTPRSPLKSTEKEKQNNRSPSKTSDKEKQNGSAMDTDAPQESAETSNKNSDATTGDQRSMSPPRKKRKSTSSLDTTDQDSMPSETTEESARSAKPSTRSMENQNNNSPVAQKPAQGKSSQDPTNKVPEPDSSTDYELDEKGLPKLKLISFVIDDIKPGKIVFIRGFERKIWMGKVSHTASFQSQGIFKVQWFTGSPTEDKVFNIADNWVSKSDNVNRACVIGHFSYTCGKTMSDTLLSELKIAFKQPAEVERAVNSPKSSRRTR